LDEHENDGQIFDVETDFAPINLIYNGKTGHLRKACNMYTGDNTAIDEHIFAGDNTAVDEHIFAGDNTAIDEHIFAGDNTAIDEHIFHNNIVSNRTQKIGISS
jgi:hypothetical protein